MDAQVSERIDHDKGKDPEHGDIVKVSIDGQPREIHRGRYVISELKEKLGVPADYELDIVINGEFKPLQDTEHIVIHGGEVFVSHVRRGGAS